MRSRLSYYWVVLLVGLAIISGLIFVMNPFNSPPAGASAPAQGATVASGAAATNSTVSSTSTSTPGGNGLGNILQPGGALAGAHHHHDTEYPGFGDGSGNSTVTTTTARAIYSQHD